MRLKANRILMSNTDVYNIINSQSKSKLDLSFVDKANYINLSDIRTDLDLIKGRNFPLVRDIMNAVESGKIILSSTGNVSSSITYIYGMDKNNSDIEKVFVNLARFSKISKGVDPATGEFRNTTTIIGGYEVLYNLLYGAYVGLKAKKVFMDSGATTILRENYVDLFSQIISRNFGNPVDGDKFRFLVNHFFFDGDVTGMDVAQATKFQLDKASTLQTQYPDWFDKQDNLKLSRFIELLAKEFPSLSRRELNPTTFVIAGASSLGDNAVYALDNFAYLLTVLATRARKAKIFPGYMLKNIESEGATISSAINRALI